MTFKEFAQVYDITIKVKRIESRSDSASDTWSKDARHFRVTLTNALGGKLRTNFSQGSAHTVDPTVEDLLCSLVSDAHAGNETFDEFCANFGYSDDSIKAQKVHKACKKIRQQLRDLLSGEAFTGAFDQLMQCEEA